MDVKAGYKTTEFWVTIAAILVGVFAPLCKSQAQADTVAQWAGNIGLIGTIVAAVAYTIQRGILKKQG